MKAWGMENPAPVEKSPLRPVESPIPELAKDEILVRVTACRICRSDLHVVQGELAPRPSPVIPGQQIVGKIKKLGEAVEGFSPDERVGIAWLLQTCGKNQAAGF